MRKKGSGSEQEAAGCGTRKDAESPQSVAETTITTPVVADQIVAPHTPALAVADHAVTIPDTPATRRERLRVLCEKLESGTALVKICGVDGMPSRSTLRQWCEEDEELAAEFAKAREAWFDVIAEQALELADLPEKFTETKGKDSGETQRAIENRKLQVETRLRLLAKWCPHRYGDSAPEPAKIQVGIGVQVTLTEERRAELMAKKRAAMEERLKQGA